MIGFYKHVKIYPIISSILCESKVSSNLIVLKSSLFKSFVPKRLFSNSKVNLFKSPQNSSKLFESTKRKINYITLFTLGSFTFLAYWVYGEYQKNKSNDETFSLDLNEIYEKQAMEFLSNPTVNIL